MTSSSSSVSLRYSFPDPQLFDSIAAIAEVRVTGGWAQDLLPPEMAMITISLSGDWKQGFDEPPGMSESSITLHGPTSRAKWIGGRDGTLTAIALHPLVWPLWFGQSAQNYANESIPFGDLMGERALWLNSSLAACTNFEARLAAVNAFFLGLPKLRRGAEMQQSVMTARLALADPDCASVEQLCARLGMSQSRVARLATSCFGFTPKTLIRVARFRRMLHRADAHSYAVWREFIEGQYVDQSHMIRDFQSFLGMSPRSYFQLERPFVSAAFAEARRLLGQTPMEADVKIAAE